MSPGHWFGRRGENASISVGIFGRLSTIILADFAEHPFQAINQRDSFLICLIFESLEKHDLELRNLVLDYVPNNVDVDGEVGVN